MPFAEHGHLGGYIIGGDPATYYPDLWMWLIQERGVQTVLDVGCGEGHALDFFLKAGALLVNGVDGVTQESELVAQHDFHTGPWQDSDWDLCWSCEFVEHVEEQYVPNFLATFACANTVLMTHAMPGQQGYHHVNCQPATYWIQQLATIDYELDLDLTIQARNLAGLNRDPHNHFIRSGLAFVRS